MTTVVASDFHLGLASGRDLLRHDEVRAKLLPVLADADEVVLLGDVVELRERPVADALAAALPVLQEIGQAVGKGRRITIVPGNHDHQLVAPLLERLRLDAQPLEPVTTFEPPHAGPLAEIARALAPAETRVAYPGVWVRDDVFATHGHYLDLHNTIPSFERLAIGVSQRVSGRVPATGPLEPEDYEAALSPVYALSYALAQSARRGRPPGAGASATAWRVLNGDGGLARRGAALVLGGVLVPGAVAALNRAGLGPLQADLSGAGLRRAALKGMEEAIERLGIDAAHVLFGHTHRSGPHDGEAFFGRLMNTGSWIHEPAFLGHAPRESPYFPGHVALVPDSGPPELRPLLDSLPTGT